MKQKHNIVCEWMNQWENSRILINPDGQVLPCCYLANLLYSDKNHADHPGRNHSLLKQYEDSAENYNIFNKELDEIVDSKWFQETLHNSWVSDNPHPMCLNMCSKK